MFDNIFVERLWRNVKYENVYPKGYATVGELTIGLAQYFTLYNDERPHQALGNRTPVEVYRSGVGGGALIVDKYPRAMEESPVRYAPQTILPSQSQRQRLHRGSAVQLRVK